eukprot:1598774-Rhodomonas_salina.2
MPAQALSCYGPKLVSHEFACLPATTPLHLVSDSTQRRVQSDCWLVSISEDRPRHDRLAVSGTTQWHLPSPEHRLYYHHTCEHTGLASELVSRMVAIRHATTKETGESRRSFCSTRWQKHRPSDWF